VRLDREEAWSMLSTAEHGVLSTVHPERGVDAVPAVFSVLDDRRLAIPIDTVKPKSTTRLRRLANIDRDPRCVLLVDHYDDDWSRLWWVRVHASAFVTDEVPVELRRFPAYAAPDAIVAAIVLTATEVTGWRATPSVAG
jgi:PPOX class probable F420-dependent enzyme